MSTKPNPDQSRSRGLLWTVVVLMAGGSALIWGSASVAWVEHRYRTPFAGEKTVSVTGSMAHAELGPVALAVLAGVAAVLATGGLLRRVIGVLAVAAGALLIWRSTDLTVGWIGYAPIGGTPADDPTVNPAGPLLLAAAGLALAVAGGLTTLRAHRMPAMGARYSAPGTSKQKVQDPDKQLWDALDADQDPTDDDRR